MKGYYAERLSGERLRLCYELAPPRIERMLRAEIDFVLERVSPDDVVLELGCGYGRVLAPLAERARAAIGIDTSRESLELAATTLGTASNCHLAQMNAVRLGMRSGSLDRVVCVQNGISAFREERRELIREACRVARPRGVVLFSSYSEKIWDERLSWFRTQADHGLVGEIDREATGNGTIVCKDGFTATTLRADDFERLTRGLGAVVRFAEVDDSTLFCELTVQGPEG
jgi:2-polyprenyl-6-hydroxyphenyl methylase/3-demethylubiquinone-9 3-methyltransferase